MADIKGRKVAVLASDGVEQVELTGPVQALRQAGAEVVVVAPKSGTIQGMNHDQKADRIQVDQSLDSISPDQFDALVLPGGVANPDFLRTQPKAVAFVRHFVDAEKPVAAICHGPWTLIEAGRVRKTSPAACIGRPAGATCGRINLWLTNAPDVDRHARKQLPFGLLGQQRHRHAGQYPPGA